MVFSSLLFLFRFLPIFIICYFAAPKRMKNFILFFGSLVFYAWGEPVYVLIMLFSILSNYFYGIWMDNSWKKGQEKSARGCLILSVAMNIGMLGFFKYAGLVSLPVGISFYTFQTMSYTIDVYRRKAAVQKNFVDFGTFVTSFPQLIAGPIVKYTDIDRELKVRQSNAENISQGIKKFIIGLSKKVLLANQIGQLWDEISVLPMSEMSVLTAWLGAAAFAFQIYFDFSGYSDMAVGLGLILGFHFPENFRYPYMAKSITEFWRRWHMTLSSWFREYVYIPLGGNRKGVGRQIINILIVWGLTGIWHGAGVNFLLWGLWFALFLIVEKIMGERFPCGKIFGHTYTLFVVLIGWVIFSANGIGTLLFYLGSMFGFGVSAAADAGGMYRLSSFGVLFILLCLGSTPYPARLAGLVREKTGRAYLFLENAILLLLLFISAAFIVDASYNPFLYFRF